MKRGPPITTRTATLLPYTTLVRSLHGDIWNPTWAPLPEWQHRPHPITYSMRAPSGNHRITAELDPIYQNIIAYHIDGLFGRADRVIYIDRKSARLNSSH